MMNCPTPVGHGWNLDGDTIQIEWMKQPPAPPDVLKTVQCRFVKGYKKSCSCVKAVLPCTGLCTCHYSSVVRSNTNVEEELLNSDSDSEPEPV